MGKRKRWNRKRRRKEDENKLEMKRAGKEVTKMERKEKKGII